MYKRQALGVVKVNFGTGMKREVLNVIKAYIQKHDIDKMDPNDVLGRGTGKDIGVLEQEAVIKYVEDTIRAMNGENQAF